MLINNHPLKNANKRQTINLVNSLSGFKSANLIGTKNDQGNFNLALFSSVFHLGAEPPLMGLIVRPDSVPRHTLENIRHNGYYTINHVHKGIYKQAHQTSARYAKEVSEFSAVNLTPELGQLHDAPYVKESYLKIGLHLRDLKPIELNGTWLVIGEVIELRIPEKALKENGYIEIEALGSVAVSSLDHYHSTQLIQTLPYAKP